MTVQTLRRAPENPQELIRLLQHELAETNREVLLLTVELDKRVEERTAELVQTQKELEAKNAQLTERTAELEAVNRELEAFSYSVSHDLRAPARRIATFIRLILGEHDSNLNQDARDLLARTSESATLMGKLIEDLLAFSRMARTEMRESPCDSSDLVRKVIQQLSTETQGRNIEWEIGYLPVVRADPALLEQAWVNLISNAIKYTRQRNPAWIQIGCADKESDWEFCIKDNGVGFDMAYVGKLFGVFQRLHREDQFEGTGIGLANVRRIITRHGGRTWAEGRVDEGAKIFFTLPK